MIVPATRRVRADQFLGWLIAFFVTTHAVVYLVSDLPISAIIIAILLSFATWIALPICWNRMNLTILGFYFLLLITTASFAWIPIIKTGDILFPAIILPVLIAEYIILILTSIALIARQSAAVSIVTSTILAVAILSTLLAFMPSQPPLHYLFGGPIPGPQIGYRLTPYSQAIQFYPSNTRNYFLQNPENQPNPWGSWIFTSNTCDPAKTVISFGTNGPQSVELSIEDPSTDRPWTSQWCNYDLQMSPNHRYKLVFTAFSAKPCTLTVEFCESNPHKTIRTSPVELQRTPKTFAIDFDTPQRTTSHGISFYLGGLRSPIVFTSLSILEDDRPCPPNSHLTPYYVQYTCNSLGFRDHEYINPKPSDTYRIVCLGDSFTWGQGVHQNDVYAKKLELLLNEERKDISRFEVINCGRCGYSTSEERYCLLQQAMEYSPDLVILQMCDNDNEQHIEGEGRTVSYDTKRSFKQCADELELLQKFCDDHRITLVAMLFRYGAMNRTWKQLLSEVKSRQSLMRLNIIDTGIDITNRPSRQWLGIDLWVDYSDGHPNEIAHQLAAKSVNSFLSRMMLVPSSPR